MSPLIATLIAFAIWIIISAISAVTAGPYLTSLVLIVGSIFVYLVVAIVLRSKTAEAFYVAERRIPAFVNGAATAADWMSAASFLSMAGAIALLGYDALPFLIGWTLGYTLLAFTVAPFIRRSETYTVPEFIEARAGGWGVARLVAVVMVFIVSLTYLTAQLTGVGVVFARFLGIAATIAVFIGVFGAIAYAWTSGWRSITWVQFIQYWVLISMYWLPVIIAASALGLFKPFPHFTYGEIIKELEAREAQFGLTLWTEPFARPFGGGTGQLNWILSAIVLMLGTMGLPHILIRFYTVKDVNAARFSVGWALLFIGLLYITASIYAAIARYSFSSLWGKPIQEVMNTPWVQKWLPTGLITIKDTNGDGILQPGELSFHGDIVVVGMPDMFGMVWLIAPLVAVGGIAAALSTADGLLLAMTTALTRDVYKRFINPRVTEAGEILFARIILIVLAFVAGFLGYLALSDPTFSRYVALIVGWAFVFAASSFTPTIILGVFWKRLNRYGIVAGMIAGMLVAVPYVVAVGAIGLPPLEIAGYKIGTIAWGIFGFFTNLIVSIIVSLATRPEGREVEEFVDKMRLPEIRK
ncbi:VC_2705 family sodium/solute symporter [Pyrobaculum aerophilum]|uniref:Cation acetate symporter n=1 Tax=Pyrobaculum aerophilum TaxID=13773 RepID=A0A371R3D8_9CREN|nr:VC_2705 family sodium/solute symporter [Pyrobaculum aerophilum]RFA98329.1 cation acetate symporter [Pyrobaculum aerophilum]RFB00447.1 cation acetate symporter [Pyrobaculum aerophilum]